MSKAVLDDPQEGGRGITWKIWLSGLIQTVDMVLSSPKEGLTFGGLSQGRSLKRAAPGPLLGTLRVGFGMGGVRPECKMGPQAGDPKHSNLLGYIWAPVGLST